MAVLKSLTCSTIALHATIGTQKQFTTPAGKIISASKLNSFKGLGIDTSQVVENEIIRVELNFKGYLTLNNLSIESLIAVKTVVEAVQQDIGVDDTVKELCPSKFAFQKKGKYLPIDVTLEDGTKVTIPGVHLDLNSSLRSIIAPNSQPVVSLHLVNIADYGTERRGDCIKVGCQYYNFKELLAFLDTVITATRTEISKLNNPTDEDTEDDHSC